jgi:hypothetical protein
VARTDQLLGFASRSDPSRGNNFLQTFSGHVFEPSFQ